MAEKTRDYASTLRFPDSPQEVSGAQIGPYQLLQMLGEGGMGSVWMAQQKEPVKRRVALKIIKLGMDTREVIARFEAESQALAMLDHPNIAKVFDAGSTESGRPYFVMELVKGVPILEYCDTEKLDTRARLELFMTVCRAIQHAHQKGIIHRDIKPSNVLVAVEDGRPAPKVIDFGVAKATNTELTQKTIFTRYRQVVGTPTYMSPEQAEMTGLDIDTRSDIYSLGVLLYELLTGTTPFAFEELMEKGYAEMMRVLRESEPHKPSTRLSTLGDTATQTAAKRRSDVKRLALALRGDLDWIVMKCLEKDRTRRYDTANGLAEDIRRHLSYEPVTAGPPSTAYRLRKFARRNRIWVLAGSAIAAVLVLGVIGTTWGLIRAVNEKSRATQAVEELEQVTAFQAGQLSEIDARLMGERLQADIVERRRAALAERSLDEGAIDAAAAELEATLAPVNFTDVALKTLDENIFERALATIERDFSDRPLIKARLLQTVANTLVELGLSDRATRPQTEAMDIRRQVLGNEHPDTLTSVNNMGRLLYRQGKLDEAETFYREALEGRRRILGDDHPDTLTSINNMGILLYRQGKLDEAEPFFREALEGRRRILGNEHHDTLSSITSMGGLLLQQGKLDEAEPFFRKALEGDRRILGNEHPTTLISINNMGHLLQQQGKLDEAEPFFREALERFRRILGNEHPNTLTSITSMGGLLLEKGKLDEAEPFFREALEGRRRILGNEHPATLSSINNLGGLLLEKGKLDQAEPFFREALEGHRRILGNEHPHTLASINNMGGLLRDLDRFAEAVELLAPNEEHVRQIFTGDNAHRLASFLTNLGRSRMGLGGGENLAVAEENLLEAHAILSELRGPGHKNTLESMQALVDLYEARHTAEPGAGHDAKAAHWRTKLNAASKEEIP